MVFQAQTQWKQISPSSGDGPAFERPLGIAEEGFYWDSVFNRTADVLRHAEIVVRGSPVETVLSHTNLTNAWGFLKQRYPLLQATIEERAQDGVVFIVDPCRSLPEGQVDLFIEEVHTPKEVDRKVDSLVNGHSPLSNTLLACLFVLRRKDEPGHAHVLIHSAHYVSDGIALDTLLRELLQLLSDPNSIFPLPWTERMALAVASESLPPNQDDSLPKARWHQAIGWTVMENRRAKIFVSLELSFRGTDDQFGNVREAILFLEQYLPRHRAHQRGRVPLPYPFRCRRLGKSFRRVAAISSRSGVSCLL
jgi:hypothetical protein